MHFSVDKSNFRDIYFHPVNFFYYRAIMKHGGVMKESDIPVETLPEIYQEIVEMVGLEAALELGKVFGGMSLYLPKIESALRGWRDLNIRREFTGTNIPQIARKYRLTSTRVRQILWSPKQK